MKNVRARVVQDNCPECRNVLLEESKVLGGLPLGGEVVLIPEHWLNNKCPHGRPGLKFELELADIGAKSRAAEKAKLGEVEFEAPDSQIDATRNIGFPVREHGPYGSHPMHDDFDDESDADGSGTY